MCIGWERYYSVERQRRSTPSCITPNVMQIYYVYMAQAHSVSLSSRTDDMQRRPQPGNGRRNGTRSQRFHHGRGSWLLQRCIQGALILSIHHKQQYFHYELSLIHASLLCVSNSHVFPIRLPCFTRISYPTTATASIGKLLGYLLPRIHAYVHRSQKDCSTSTPRSVSSILPSPSVEAPFAGYVKSSD